MLKTATGMKLRPHNRAQQQSIKQNRRSDKNPAFFFLRESGKSVICGYNIMMHNGLKGRLCKAAGAEAVSAADTEGGTDER